MSPSITVTGFLQGQSGLAEADLSRVRRAHTNGPSPLIPPDCWPLAEQQYLRFLSLKRLYPTELLIPDGYALRVWQGHILDTRSYRADCERLFGRFIDHFPYLGLDKQAEHNDQKEAVRRLQTLQARHFLDCADPQA